MQAMPWVSIAGALVIALGSGAAAQTTSPGGHSVFVAASNVPITGNNSAILTGTLAKGKKHRVLAVEATAVNTDQIGYYSSFLPRVNGVRMTGPLVGNDWATSGMRHVTDTGTWWLDLDAAEAAHPGTFIGLPLVVELMGNDGGCSGPSCPPPVNFVNATMTARLTAH